MKKNCINGAVAVETDKKQVLQKMTATAGGLRPLLLLGFVNSSCLIHVC
jgi:hypothetical protein